MIATDLASKIRQQVADRFSVELREPEWLDVTTPFMFSDGDHYGFAVVREPATHRWMLTDEGEVVSKAHYQGIDLLAPGRNERTRHAIDFYGLRERDGELSLIVEDGDFGQAFFRFSQACMDISRLALLPASPSPKVKARGEAKSRVASLVKRALPSVRFQPKWHHPHLDPHGIYPVDFHIPSETPVLVFSPETDVECLHSTISCLHYRQNEMDFEGVAIADDSRLSARNILALEDAKVIRFSSDQEDELVEFLQSKAA